jgi:fused signal recognition particle receptor
VKALTISSFGSKMKRQGLGSRIKQLFSGGVSDEELYEELEEALVSADVGAKNAMEIVDAIREASSLEGASSRDSVTRILRREIESAVRAADFTLDPGKLNIVLVLGVNGVGKTTTIAKLAHHFRETGQTDAICLAAGDTFRAAAVEQLTVHAERLGVRIVKQSAGADPGAVIYDAIESANSRGERLVIADTAGRMHTKKHLVEELSKIDRIVSSRAPDASYRRILVVDATTGQNGLHQAEIFCEAVPIDAIVLAKYDSTARGGILVPISRNLNVPTAFLGTGEKYENLKKFVPAQYAFELTEA